MDTLDSKCIQHRIQSIKWGLDPTTQHIPEGRNKNTTTVTRSHCSRLNRIHHSKIHISGAKCSHEKLQTMF